MANKVLTRVWEHSQQRGAARCLVLALADVADDHGIAYPGIPYLATMINEAEDYTYKLLRKLIEAGEVLHKPGGGRTRKTSYAVVVGLTDAQRAKTNTVLQSRVYHEKTAKNPVLQSSVSEQNPGLQNTVLQNTVLPSEKPCTILDSKQLAFSAPEPSESPTDEKEIHGDPFVGGGGGGGGGARALESYLSSLPLFPATVALNLDPDTVIAACERLRADGWGNGAIADQIRKYPPVKGQPYAKPEPARSVGTVAPDSRRPSERIGERPTLPPGLKIAGRKHAE